MTTIRLVTELWAPALYSAAVLAGILLSVSGGSQ